MPYELIGSRQCGSAIVEMALSNAGLDVTVVDLPYLEAGAGRERLLRLNPLGQVPTLVLPDGGVMTESAAIMLHIGDVAPETGLVPGPREDSRPAFLNLLVLLVAAVYPTFTYGDEPARWTGGAAGADQLRAATDERRKLLFRHVEAMLPADGFAFGGTVGAVDLYLAAMSRWRPGLAWFEAECPRIAAVAARVFDVPAARRALDRHGFPTGAAAT